MMGINREGVCINHIVLCVCVWDLGVFAGVLGGFPRLYTAVEGLKTENLSADI